jgi:hypothetical protein
MLQEQAVVADPRPVGLAQEAVPQLALDGDLGVRVQPRPQLLQADAGAAEGQALAA